jgi:DNA-binding response OmpR family regulator
MREPTVSNAPFSGVVLVVDDSPENLSMLTEALDQAGYTVLVAVDGSSAIERAKLAAPDAILLDAVMPELNGFDTCIQLKSHEATKAIPVIFMTGLSESEHVVKAFAVGAVDYVTKPLAPDAVIARIRAHVRTSQLMHGTEDAVELSGRAVLIVSSDGSLLWLFEDIGPHAGVRSGFRTRFRSTRSGSCRLGGAGDSRVERRC